MTVPGSPLIEGLVRRIDPAHRTLGFRGDPRDVALRAAIPAPA